MVPGKSKKWVCNPPPYTRHWALAVNEYVLYLQGFIRVKNATTAPKLISRSHSNFKMSRMGWLWLMLEHCVEASWVIYRLNNYIFCHLQAKYGAILCDCILLEQNHKLQRINFRHWHILNSPHAPSWCRVRTASCPIFMAIIQWSTATGAVSGSIIKSREDFFWQSHRSPVGYLGA